MGAEQQVKKASFYFDLDLSANLSISEIWPNGDAPENPTVEDVIERVQSSNLGLSDFIRNWNMDCAGRLSIDGTPVRL